MWRRWLLHVYYLCNHKPATILTIWPHMCAFPPAAQAGGGFNSLAPLTREFTYRKCKFTQLTLISANRHWKTGRWLGSGLRKGLRASPCANLRPAPGAAAGSLPPGRFHGADLGRPKAFLRPTTRLPPLHRQALAQPKV